MCEGGGKGVVRGDEGRRRGLKSFFVKLMHFSLSEIMGHTNFEIKSKEALKYKN